jgi:hypothetical protein
MLSQVALSLDGSSDGRVGRSEHDEEGVAGGTELVAALAEEGVAEKAMVGSQCLRVAVAEVLEKERGASDVGEEEGDRALGQESVRIHTCDSAARREGRRTYRTGGLPHQAEAGRSGVTSPWVCKFPA